MELFFGIVHVIGFDVRMSTCYRRGPHQDQAKIGDLDASRKRTK